MRLTLRTLLAYLDDRLSPAHAKELGQKLAASPFATELADRIRDVVRRRRLAKESIEHKSIDANLIAEYLDDQLTPELIALIEKEILSSDQSLAEVAATHQILGLLSDPVEISDPLKERLYALAPVVEKEDSGEDGQAPAGPASESESQWQPLQRPTEAQKRSPMILLAVMVLGWLVLLATDANLFGTGQPGDNESGDPALAGVDGDNIDQNPVSDASDENEGSNTTTQDGNSQSGREPAGTNSDTDPESADTDDAAGSETAQPETDKTSGSETKTSGSETNVATADAAKPDDPGDHADGKGDAGASNEANVPAAFRLELVDDHQMVAIHDAETDQWSWASRGAGVTVNRAEELSGRMVMLSEPFSAELRSPNHGWSVRLLGPVIVRIADDATGALQLIEGRVLLRRYVNEKASTIRIHAGQRIVDVSIPSNGQLVGIEARPLPIAAALDDEAEPPPGLQPLFNPALLTVSAINSAVTVRVAQSEASAVVAQGSHWQWDTRSDMATEGSTVQRSPLPEWTFEAQKAPSGLAAEILKTAAAAYQQSDLVSDAAHKLTDNANPEIASFGVRHMGQLRDVEGLLQLLLQSEHQFIRHESAACLQRIVQLTPRGRSEVVDSLETRLPGGELTNAMKLISGVSPVAAEDVRTSDWLIDMLASNRVAFRDLAIFNLKRLMNNENFGFFADEDLARRQAAIKRWRRFLDKNDGRLIKPQE